jgi:FKBP-type peptidyl-prolyl cis-trans isomerase
LRVNRFLSAVVVFSVIGCSASNEPMGPSGELVTEDLVVGAGALAVTGDTVTMHYVGRLQSGAVFEDSYALARPFTFRLGAGQAIAGWDQGIPGMRIGGKRRLTIPPHLAYGSAGRGPIPPNATILFEVELMAIAGK